MGRILLMLVPLAAALAPSPSLQRANIISPRCASPCLRKPYKPQGLTDAQWAAIKDADAAREQGKNYGAWGPRFQRVAPPFWATAGFLAKTGAIIRGDLSSDMPSIWRRISLSPLPRLLLGGAVLLLAATLAARALSIRAPLSFVRRLLLSA